MTHDFNVEKSDYNDWAGQRKSFVTLKSTKKNPVEKGQFVNFHEVDKDNNRTGRTAEYKVIYVQEKFTGFRLSGNTKYVGAHLEFIQLSM